MKTVILTIQFTDSKWKGIVCEKFIFCNTEEEVRRNCDKTQFMGNEIEPSYKVLHCKVIDNFDPFKYARETPPIKLTP